jgi:hypothetical protein
MSPYDIFLFAKLKSRARGVHFRDINNLFDVLDEAIDNLTENDIQNGFADWFNRMKKCIDVQSEYFEKMN